MAFKFMSVASYNILKCTSCYSITPLLTRTQRLNFFSTVQQQPIQQQNFVLIYSLPSIRYASLINRVKLLQTFMSATLFPASFLFESQGILGSGGTAGLGVLVVLSNIIFYSIGSVLNNFIGKIYISKDRTEVMLSYVSFWGKREDKVVPIANVDYAEDTNGLTKVIYSKVRIHNPIINLKLNLKNAVIYDHSTFKSVFGESVFRLMARLGHLIKKYSVVVFFPTFTVTTIFADWNHTRKWKARVAELKNQEIELKE